FRSSFRSDGNPMNTRLRGLSKGLPVLLGGLFVFSSLSPSTANEGGRAAAVDADTGLPSKAAIKDCLEGSQAAECLDRLFRQPLQRHTTTEALRWVQRLEAEDPDIKRMCHPVVHAIGRETFRLKGNIHDSFAACDQTCHSGCYHGSVERFLRGEEI